MRYFDFLRMLHRRKAVVAVLAATFLILAGCQKSTTKVLIGATAIVAPGAQPIEDSVVLIGDGRIRIVGVRKDVPIPQDSERFNVSGKWIEPANGGRLAPNEPANLLVLNSQNPGDVSRKMINGEWQQ